MKLALAPSVLVTSLFSALPAGADVFDVGGPTPDHAQISAAVAAAQDGDVIRVWPGTYQAFTVTNKSLAVVRATTSGAVLVAGTIRVRDLAATRSVALTGISATGADGRALIATNCAGSVRVRDGQFQGAHARGPFPFDGHAGGFVSSCSDVAFADCVFLGGFPSSGEFGGPGAEGLIVESSILASYRSSFIATSGTTDDDPGASGYSGGDGVRVSGISRVHLSGCALQGGDGGDADVDPDFWTGEYGYGGDGGYGLRGPGAWFLDCSLQGGDAGWSPAPGHQGSPGLPSSGGQFLPGESRCLRVTPLASELALLSVQLTGAPGDRVLLRSAAAPGSQFSVRYGPWLIQSLLALELDARDLFQRGSGWLPLGVLDALGTLQVSIQAQDLPHLGHAQLHLQAVFLGAESYFGAPSWSAILDSAW